MKIGYIKQFENDEELLTERQKKYWKLFRNTIAKLKKFFCIPNLIELDDCIIVVLPTFQNEEISHNKIKKIVKKIRKKTYLNNVAISNFLLKMPNFKNYIEKSGMNILDGTWLWDHMILDLIEFVTKQKQEEIQKQEITILVKEIKEINIINIIEIAKKVKLVNVATDRIERFKNIENYLYDTYGIVIRISSGKKVISKSNIIINIDLTEQEINTYNIPDKAVIFNRNKNINIYSKKFSGINSTSFEIDFPNENINELKEYNINNNFSKVVLYESTIYRKDSYKNIRNNIEKDNIKILRAYWKKRKDR